MDQVDATNLLEAKRADRNPKCANCKHWDFLVADQTAAPCDQHDRTTTLDLSVCSDWEKRDAAL